MLTNLVRSWGHPMDLENGAIKVDTMHGQFDKQTKWGGDLWREHAGRRTMGYHNDAWCFGTPTRFLTNSLSSFGILIAVNRLI